MIARTIVIAGGVFSAVAVMLGAFGAHGLKNKISSEQLQVFETGVRYQMYHAFALILLGLLADRFPHPLLRTAGYFMMIGILLFSGSIYLLATRELMGIDSWKSFLGPITPIGGLCLILGWICMSWGVYRSNIL